MTSILIAIIYLAFISLGLPDSMLGSAWPTIYKEFGVNVSWMGIISMIISAGTVVSSLNSDKLTKRFGAGKVTVASVALTALALLGFSFSHSFISLCILAIPYGLGAGSVDAALNNYVALHLEAKHMSWLHCMWGLGALTGPVIMGAVLSANRPWNMGYRIVGIIQLVIVVIIFVSLPKWEASEEKDIEDKGLEKREPIPLHKLVRLPGIKNVMLSFFCYCAIEQTVMGWGSTYLVLEKGVDETTAAKLAVLFVIGITIGRALNGFLAIKFNDVQLIYMGFTLISIGVVLLFLPFSNMVSFIALIIVGLGCAPVYPCFIHSTPELFGEDMSQAVIGVQMASAYVGVVVMPPLFGFLAKALSFRLFPYYILILELIMVFVYSDLRGKKTGGQSS